MNLSNSNLNIWKYMSWKLKRKDKLKREFNVLSFFNRHPKSRDLPPVPHPFRPFDCLLLMVKVISRTSVH